MPSVPKIDAGVSVKLHRDVYADARALEGRLGCGRGVNKVFRELIRRESNGAVAAILAAQRLERIEEMLTRLVQKIGDGDDDDAASSTPPTFKAE